MIRKVVQVGEYRICDHELQIRIFPNDVFTVDYFGLHQFLKDNYVAPIYADGEEIGEMQLASEKRVLITLYHRDLILSLADLLNVVRGYQAAGQIWENRYQKIGSPEVVVV